MPLAGAPSSKLALVTSGVWFRSGFSNTMIVEMKDYLVVIDSGMKDTALATQADCRALSPKPVKYVFLTHHHFDHVTGNPVWTAAGATTMAFAGVKGELDRFQGKFEAPRRILEGDSFVLNDGTRRLEFYFYGWAHTKGDGFAYLPREKVLFTGDAVVNGPFNSFMDSDVRNWPKVIRRLEALDVRHVLPGHGKPGSKKILRGQREYLEALVAEVTRAIQQGKKLEDLVEMKDGTPTVSRLALPSSVDHWAKDSLAGPTEEWPLKGPASGRKVRDVYAQLSR